MQRDSLKNILTITKCYLCGKMFKVPLDLKAVRAFENSTEVHLICFDCVKVEQEYFKG